MFRMQVIRRILPRFAQTLLHGPQVAQRLSIPAHSLLQRRLYADDVPRAFPYYSRALLKEEHLRTLPYKERLAYIVAKSANMDVAPSSRILIRGLQPSIKLPDIETSSLLSGNVGISGSTRKGFLYVEFPSQEEALNVMQKINTAIEYPFVVEGGSSNVVVPVYAEYAKNNKKTEPTPAKVLYIPEYHGTLDELRAMFEPFSQGYLEICKQRKDSARTLALAHGTAERTITDRRHIWVDLGSIENAKSALEACARRTYGYGDGKEAILGVYYGRIQRT